MHHACTAAIAFADALVRIRPLTSAEAAMLEPIVKGGDDIHPRWTSDEDRRLVGLAQAQTSRKRIASELRRSPEAVRCRLARLRKLGRL